MNSKSRAAIILLPLFIAQFYGCAPYEEVRETIYMQDALMKVPLIQTPVFLSTGDSTSIINFTPRISFGNKKSVQGKAGIHTKVNAEGIYRVDIDSSNGYYSYIETPGVNSFTYRNDNYKLITSLYSIGFDVDLNVSRSFALTGGYVFSKIENTGLDGYRGGIAFKKFNTPYGIRLDGGLIWQESFYDVSSVVVSEKTEWFSETRTTVAFYRDEGIQKNLNFYINFNFTYIDELAPIGGFFNIGYNKQTMLDIEPQDYNNNYYSDPGPYLFGKYSSEDLRSEIQTAFINFNTGVLFRFFDSYSLVGGIRYIIETGGEDASINALSSFFQVQVGL